MERNKILVVDDEEDLCEILQFNLESEGFAVDIANSAEEALKLLTDEHELILLDVMMEGMSGFKMAEKVRKEMHRRRKPARRNGLAGRGAGRNGGGEAGLLRCRPVGARCPRTGLLPREYGSP